MFLLCSWFSSLLGWQDCTAVHISTIHFHLFYLSPCAPVYFTPEFTNLTLFISTSYFWNFSLLLYTTNWPAEFPLPLVQLTLLSPIIMLTLPISYNVLFSCLIWYHALLGFLLWLWSLLTLECWCFSDLFLGPLSSFTLYTFSSQSYLFSHSFNFNHCADDSQTPICGPVPLLSSKPIYLGAFWHITGETY